MFSTCILIASQIVATGPATSTVYPAGTGPCTDTLQQVDVPKSGIIGEKRRVAPEPQKQ